VTKQKAKIRSKKAAKRPADVNKLAQYLGAFSTGEQMVVNPGPTPSEVSRVMAALGRKGGKIGGRRRADILSPKKRKEIASQAARTRWARAKKPS